jgi:S1-C subfamily serine protease
MKHYPVLLLSTLLLTVTLCPAGANAEAPAADEPEAQSARQEQVRAEYEAMLEEAEQARAEAETARREAARAAERAREAARMNEALARERAQATQGELKQIERERAQRAEELARLQEELSRAHRELREATREIARAHRDVARSGVEYRVRRHVNLGDHVVLGVVLGRETAEGVEIIGVSPDGPAERAGLQAGDVLVSIRGESLTGLGDEDASTGRETVYRVLSETQPGEELTVVVDRDGESWTFNVTAEQREPSSWQTMIRIPEHPAVAGAPHAPVAPHVAIEGIEIPEIDEEALNEHIRQVTEELRAGKLLHALPAGAEFEFDEHLVLPDDFEVAELSELAEQALEEANVWFGLPQSQGLELARINEGLGEYFKTDRGVLVIRAREDNAYQLESGDVVLDINDTAVNSPADLMRALREIEPGSDVELAIKRDRRDQTLKVPMPENRLGYAFPPRPDH